MSLNTLENNLHEIYAVGHSQEARIVPDIFGKHVYSSISGWGRFWSWIYEFAKIFRVDDLEKSCFQKAMSHTHQLFKENIAKADAACRAYQAHLQKLCRGEAAPEGEVSKERRFLCHWHNAVNPFLKLARGGFPTKIKSSISAGFIEQYSQEYQAPFTEGALAEQFKCQRQIIKLEGILQAPMPIAVLLKAAAREPLNKQEKKTFKKFVKKLNTNHEVIGIRLLHASLQSIISLGKVHMSPKANITFLEMALANLDCKQILQIDPKHIAKRALLKPGDEVVCNGRILTLGERLGEDPIGFDQNIVMATDDPSLVLLIGVNSMIHHLKCLLAEEESWGIQSVEYKDIDNQSGYALIERLYDHLQSYVWISNSDQIDAKDEDLAFPIWRLLQWFLKQNRTPLNFSPQYLMFDQQGYLKCLKVALKGDLDFNALVKFAYECSSGNPFVFRYLMEKSELHAHLYARYYQDMVEYAARDEKHAAEDVAAYKNIIDSRIIKQGKALVDEVAVLKEKCWVSLKKIGFSGPPQTLTKEIAEELILSYAASYTAGLLPANLEEDIVARVIMRQKNSSVL